MKRIHISVFFVLVMSLSALAAPQDSYLEKISVLNAPNAPGTVSQERVATCMRLIAQDLQVDPASLPNIVVMHVTAREAEAAGIRATGVRHNVGANESSNYYEFWIIGRPRSVDYATALYSVLENHVGHRLPQSERLAIMRRALRYLDATLSAAGE